MISEEVRKARIREIKEQYWALIKDYLSQQVSRIRDYEELTGMNKS